MFHTLTKSRHIHSEASPKTYDSKFFLKTIKNYFLQSELRNDSSNAPIKQRKQKRPNR